MKIKMAQTPSTMRSQARPISARLAGQDDLFGSNGGTPRLFNRTAPARPQTAGARFALGATIAAYDETRCAPLLACITGDSVLLQANSAQWTAVLVFGGQYSREGMHRCVPTQWASKEISTIPRVLWWSYRGWLFLMSEVPL